MLNLLLQLAAFLVDAVHLQLVCALHLLLPLLPDETDARVLLARKQMREDGRFFEPDFEYLSLGGLGGFVVSYVLFGYFSPGELEGVVLHEPVEYGPLGGVPVVAAGDFADVEPEGNCEDCIDFEYVLRGPDFVVIWVVALDAEVEAAAGAIGHLQLLVHQHILPLLHLEHYLAGAEGHVLQIQRLVVERLEGQPTAGLVGALRDLAALELFKAAHIYYAMV